jgi:sterol 24-C-methyltransferase
MPHLTDSPDEAEPLINENPQLQSYYQSLESRIGYRLLLGGTRHFGWYEHDTWWPFPLSRGMRNMEDKLAEALALPPGAQVLDAGCGVGHVAIRMARTYGLRVKAIDVVQRHVEKARRNVAASGLPKNTITVARGDYHNLDSFDSASLDGVYTMETFVHATDPEAVLAGFYRLLKPGGRLVQFEYDHELPDTSVNANDRDLTESMRKINEYSAMPTNARSHPGVFKTMLEDAGFENVEVRDYSENIRPMTRFFFLLAIIPYIFVRLFGIEKYFINTVAGVETYRGKGHWRYVAISANKPGAAQEPAKSK